MRLVYFILTLQMLGEVLRDFSLLFKSEKNSTFVTIFTGTFKFL